MAETDEETLSTLSSTDSENVCPNGKGLEEFLEKLTGLMHQDNVIAIRHEQMKIMNNLEVANWKLASLNDISETTFMKCSADFKQHIKMLQDMKKQLDSIFRRIRNLKVKAASLYPEAYAKAELECAERFGREMTPDD